MLQRMTFSADLQEVPVTLVRNGITEFYVLLEMDGVNRDKWMNNLSKRSETVGEGKDALQRVVNFQKLDAEMLFGNLWRLPEADSAEDSWALWKADDSRKIIVNVDDIQKLPGATVSKLATKLRQISSLVDEETEAKNDLAEKGKTGSPSPQSSDSQSE